MRVSAAIMGSVTAVRTRSELPSGTPWIEAMSLRCSGIGSRAGEGEGGRERKYMKQAAHPSICYSPPPHPPSTAAATTLLWSAHIESTPQHQPLPSAAIMHISSAALLLLLVPATRAAAIPNQGGRLGADFTLSDLGPQVGDLGAILRDDHVDGPAKARRDEAVDLLGPVGNAPAKVETVSEASNVAAALATAKRDADDDALANSIKKLNYEQIGALVKLLKAIGGGGGSKSKRNAEEEFAEVVQTGFAHLEFIGADTEASAGGTHALQNTVSGSSPTGKDINTIEDVEDLAAAAAAGNVANQNDNNPLESIGQRSSADAPADGKYSLTVPAIAATIEADPEESLTGESKEGIHSVKEPVHQAKRDDVEAQLREYIAETSTDLTPEQAERLLAGLLAAYKSKNQIARRDTTGNKDVELPVSTPSELDDTPDLFVFLDTHGKRLAQRDDVEAHLREYIAETFKDLNPEQAAQLLADLLAAYKGNNPIASRDTTGTDAGVVNIVEYVEEIAAGATGDVPVPKNSQIDGTPFVPIGRRNVADPLAPAAAAAAGEAALADPLADLVAHIAKENPNLSLEEVKDLVAAMTEGVGPKYVKRDGGVVAGGLGETIDGVVGITNREVGSVQDLVYVIVLSSEQWLNLNGKRDTTGNGIDATNIIDPTTKTAAGVVGEVGGAGVKGAAEDKEAKIDNVKAYYVNEHTGEVRKLSPEEIKKLVAGLTPGSAKARRDDAAVLLAHLGAKASDTATGTLSVGNVARASILVEAVVEGGKGGKGKGKGRGKGKGKGKGKEDKSKDAEE
ncbi:hypothetical protein V500_06542 [Pseudogymnoascus sp. VKM F-4518 (FW-2643)]|nr:hypothetical protein V500_06542 [Pseudogymnoascus sp. VKM F-4518 (FW-2643)]